MSLERTIQLRGTQSRRDALLETSDPDLSPRAATAPADFQGSTPFASTINSQYEGKRRVPSALKDLFDFKPGWHASLGDIRALNWGKPLRSYRTIVQLIAATTTEARNVCAELNENQYPKAINISDVQPVVVNVSRHAFHSDRNYTIVPSRKNSRSPKAKLTALSMDKP